MYKQKILNNGLRLITAPMRGTRTATILVLIGTGSKYETRDNSGISHFLEHLFFKGTKKRPTTLALSAELDSLGAEYNAFTGKEYTGYWVKADCGKIERAIEIVADILLASKFESAEIEREKGVIIEEMNMYQDNPMMHIEDVFETLLYGDNPAGRDTIGTKKNILKFKRADFIKYFQAQYGVANTLVCLAGNFSGFKNSERVGALIKKYFSFPQSRKRSANFKEKLAVRETQTRPQARLHYQKTDQAHLCLGVRSFGYSHSDRLAAKLLAIILGGSMSSRLLINLRERQGLAYYVRTETESYTDSGYLTTRAGVPLGKLERAITTILAEYRKLTKNLVTKKEFLRVRDMISGRLAIQAEASDNIADWYGRQTILAETIKRVQKNAAIDILTPTDYLETIKKITPVDIRRVARNIFLEEGLNLAVIGPFKDTKHFSKLLKI